jgi:hypothetical protein
MMWGGKVTRKRFRAAKRTEIAVIAGQKILGAMALCSASPPGEAIKIVKGETIRAKTHAEIGTTAHLSIIGDEGTGRDRDDCAAVKIGVVAGPNSKECIEPLDILAFYWRPPWMSLLASALDVPLPLNTLGQLCRSIPGINVMIPSIESIDS